MKRRVLLLLAGLLLVAASLAIWQFRFEAIPDGLPPNGIDDPPVGWVIRPAGEREVIRTPEGPVLRLARTEPDGRGPGIRIWLGSLPEVRFIHVHCECRWRDIGPVGGYHMDTRLMVLMKDSDGKLRHPPDGRIVKGDGSSDWVSTDIVFALSREMTDTGFDFAILARHGEVEIRDLTLTAVRPRAWSYPALVLVVLGWTIWFAVALPVTIAGWRKVLAATALTAFCWFLVFPQSKRKLPSLLGHFPVARQAAVQPPRPEPAPAPPPPPTRAEPAAPRQATPPGRPDPAIGAEAPAATAPVPRDSEFLRRTVTHLDEGSEVLHLAIFGSFSLAIFLLIGRATAWPMLVGVAFLSEIVPNLIDRSPDLHDILDLTENLVGVGLGLLGWKLACAWWRRLKRQKPAPEATGT